MSVNSLKLRCYFNHATESIFKDLRKTIQITNNNNLITWISDPVQVSMAYVKDKVMMQCWPLKKISCTEFNVAMRLWRCILKHGHSDPERNAPWRSGRFSVQQTPLSACCQILCSQRCFTHHEAPKNQSSLLSAGGVWTHLLLLFGDEYWFLYSYLLRLVHSWIICKSDEFQPQLSNSPKMVEKYMILQLICFIRTVFWYRPIHSNMRK